MKQLRNYINVRKGKSTIKATNETIDQIVKDELDRLGHDADLNHIDVSGVTSMRHLFNYKYNMSLDYTYGDINPDISKWDVSNVDDMYGVFWYSIFNGDISGWDVSKVKDMQYMFCRSNFNGDISGWVVRNVICMDYMFYKCKNFNQDISRWDVNNVKYYEHVFDGSHIKEEFKPHFIK